MITKTHEHLEWAIESRARNQRCCLRLLRLFDADPDYWRTTRPSRVAQELTAVAFSLWRAAFLAEKSGKRAEVFKHGRDFLAKLIEDNAIAYVQGKASKEWTFNYYTRHAKYSLKFVEKFWGEGFPVYQDAIRSPRDRWDYCQNVLDEAVTFFEGVAEAQKASREDQAIAKRERVRKSAVREAAGVRRRNSRELTAPDRAARKP